VNLWWRKDLVAGFQFLWRRRLHLGNKKKHVGSTKDGCRLVRKTFKMILSGTSSKFAASTGDNEDRWKCLTVYFKAW
jgi:hypothetical protein